MENVKKMIIRTNSYDTGSEKKIIGDSCCDISQDTTEKSASFSLGLRHLVAFLGFLLCSLVSLHRTAMSVTIVAMVNHTEAKILHQLRSNATESCSMLIPKQDNSTTVEADGEFDWNSQLQGNVIAVGFLGFLFSNLFSGRLAEVWGAKKTLFYGNLLTAFFTVISPQAAWWNAYALIAVQLARGVAQGFTFAPLYVLMANWFPRSERGLLSTFVMCGFSTGAVAGGLVAGRICDIQTLGWPVSFYVTGGISAIITVIFAFLFYELPHNHPYISKEELKYITQGQESDMSKKRPPAPWKEMFTSLPVYSLFIGMFGFYWSITHFMSVHPTFMGTILQYSMTENGMLSSLPFLAMGVGAVFSSFCSVWITTRNVLSVDKVRKCCSSISAFGFSLCLLGVILAGCNRAINILCFTISQFFIGVGLSGTMIACGDMSPIFAGSLVSVSSTLSSTAAAVMPVLVGALTKHETLEEWQHAFFMHIAVVLCTALVFHVFGSAEVQPWNSPPTTDEPEKQAHPISSVEKKCAPLSFSHTHYQSTHM